MARRKLLWRLYPTYLAVILLCIVGVSVFALRYGRRLYRDQVSEALEVRCHLVAREMRGQILGAETGELQSLCRALGQVARTRITVIDPAGRVLADSREEPGQMENHSDRPEIMRALAGRSSRLVRWSPTQKLQTMYVAVPVRRGGQVRAVVRTALPLGELDEPLDAMSGRVWLGGAAVAVLAAGIALLVTRRLSAPVREMARVASSFARGELDRKVVPPDIEELAQLAESLNRMAASLRERILATDRQNRQYEAVLSSMQEGVLAIDRDETVLNLNDAGADLLDVDPRWARGKALPEVTRNVLLERFAIRTLGVGEPIEAEIVFHDGEERYVRVRGSALCDAANQRIGALIIMREVTRMRQLEDVRRNFVANVSHELRTPVTAIQGFVETLQEDMPEDAGQVRRFLDILRDQAARLSNIIDDLLALARVEREAETEQLELTPAPVRDVLEGAREDCRQAARNRDVQVSLGCPPDLTAPMNPNLLEQAVANLIDNAVKYSEPGSRVRVEAQRRDHEVIIQVSDQGCGIPPEHLPHVFERFYCVDKARSRQLGGTGLGLALVKHIARAHGGSVEARSEIGKGSTFTIRLPRT